MDLPVVDFTVENSKMHVILESAGTEKSSSEILYEYLSD